MAFLITTLMICSVFASSRIVNSYNENIRPEENYNNYSPASNVRENSKQLTVTEDYSNENAYDNGLKIIKEDLSLTDKNTNEIQPLNNRESDYFWMDFNPSSDPHTVDGGRFESESWTCDHDEWEVGGGTPFDDTGDMSWPSSSYTGIYSVVRADEDLNDGTTADGAWCSCAKETGGAWNNEDSRGWATVEKSFDLGDFVDTSLPNFAFTDAIFYCDYKIHAADFDCGDSHVYFNIYLDDGDDEWPIAYEYFSNSGDAPSGTNGGYCIDFWDPDYSAPHGSNPLYTYDNYNNDIVTISTDGQGGQTVVYLEDFFNNFGETYTLKFKLFVRLFGGWGGQSERYKFWVDHVRIKCNYEYYYPDLEVTDIWIVPDTFYHGDTVDLKAEIKNSGDGKAENSFKVNMYFDGTNLGYAQISAGMPAGETATITLEDFEWPNNINTHTIKVVADTDNDVEESNENNNEREEDFTALNHVPNTPSLSGTTTGWHNTEYSYTISATDDDGDDLKYYIDWGDGTNTGWMGWYSSGESVTKQHTWDEPGNYNVKGKAKDEFGEESDEVTLSIYMGNRAPNKPNTPSGEIDGNHGIEYSYTSSTTDPDNDKVCYKFDWGDGSSTDWTGLLNSGETVTESHTWDEPGNYEVKVKAKDEYDEESSWSDILYVTMTNLAPDTPSDPDPEDMDDWVDINADLSWDCADPNGDPLKYDVYLDDINPPEEKVSTGQTSKTYNPGEMQPGTTYYWQIIAKDDWDSTVGPIWQFTTREYNPPKLTNYNNWPEGIDEEWGTNSYKFTFRVHYYDQDGDPPQSPRLYVKLEDGTLKNYDMQCEGSDPADSDYKKQLQGSEFGGGIHSYYFEFTDITGESDRLPDTGFWYFTVNHRPSIPNVVGDDAVKKDEEYICQATATDDDGDKIQYWFEWGDGSSPSGWVPVEPVSSGTTEIQSHTYDEYETVTIKVKARDVHGDESDWGTLSVEVPRSRQSIRLIIFNLLEQFPILERLLSLPIFARLLNIQ